MKPSQTKRPQQEWPEWRSMATRIFGLSCFQLGFVYFMKGDMSTDILTTLAQKKTRTSLDGVEFAYDTADGKNHTPLGMYKTL